MIGKGKYDELCTDVRTRAAAEGAIVIVFGGRNGNGFSAQLPLIAYFDIVRILRDVADALERDGLSAGGNG